MKIKIKYTEHCGIDAGANTYRFEPCIYSFFQDSPLACLYYGIQIGQLIRCQADQTDLGVRMAEHEHIDATDARWFSRGTGVRGANTDPAAHYRFKT